MEASIFINRDGNISSIGDIPQELEQAVVGTVKRQRASNILPVNRFKRALFLALRAVFGERGKVAEFTRQWQGPWICFLFATGETFVAQSRRVCLQWEHERLEAILGGS
jgi:hypothetical protein